MIPGRPTIYASIFFTFCLGAATRSACLAEDYLLQGGPPSVGLAFGGFRDLSAGDARYSNVPVLSKDDIYDLTRVPRHEAAATVRGRLTPDSGMPRDDMEGKGKEGIKTKG